MKRCWNCRDFRLVGLMETDFYSFICSLPSVTEAWTLQHGSECSITSLSMDSRWINLISRLDCVICPEAYEALFHCFSTPCLTGLKHLTIKPMEEDKSSRVNEKNWRCICDRLKMGACPSLESIYLPGNCIGTAGVEAHMEVSLTYRQFTKCRKHADALAYAWNG